MTRRRRVAVVLATALPRKGTHMRRTALMLLAMVLAVTGAETPAQAAEDVLDPQIVLAELGYTNGVRATFTKDSVGGDLGLVQGGPVNRTGPLVDDPGSGMLQAYLSITPKSVAVPYLLLPPAGAPTPPGLAGRTISSTTVRADNLTAPSTVQATRDCWEPYWNNYNWYEPAERPDPNAGPGHGDKTYYVSTFYGSMKQFADSYVANCGWEPVRHRVSWRDADGDYHTHHDATIAFGHWQAVHKGSVVRWRKVTYAAGKYTRNGRFHN
jgi:hypothetical protein